VSDEQWKDDLEYVETTLRPVGLEPGWEPEVLDEGAGEPILFVPIVAHVEAIYARQVRDLVRDHRVITYRRREGRDRPISLQERAQELVRLLDGLGVDRAHVVGRSEGGMVAAEFAYRHPDRCRSLVLITVAIDYHQGPPAWISDLQNRLMLRVGGLAEAIGDERIRHMVVRYLSGSEQRLTYDQLMLAYSRIPEFAHMYRYSAVPLLLGHDLRGKAQRISPPTLLIGSTEDPRATVRDLEDLGAALPDCRGTIMVPDGGHFVNYIRGDEVNARIRDFYAELAQDHARSESAVGKASD
jgi:pimeloyl-ACP methyl ester carboxylesterase